MKNGKDKSHWEKISRATLGWGEKYGMGRHSTEEERETYTKRMKDKLDMSDTELSNFLDVTKLSPCTALCWGGVLSKYSPYFL